MKVLSNIFLGFGGAIFALGMVARRVLQPEHFERLGMERSGIIVVYIIGGAMMGVGYLLAKRAKDHSEQTVESD